MQASKLRHKRALENIAKCFVSHSHELVMQKYGYMNVIMQNEGGEGRTVSALCEIAVFPLLP